LRVVNWVEIEIANTLFPFLAFIILYKQRRKFLVEVLG